VVYNGANNEFVRTNTLVKGEIIKVDAAPFRLWYESYYGVPLGKKAEAAKAAKKAAPAKAPAKGAKKAAPAKDAKDAAKAPAKDAAKAPAKDAAKAPAKDAAKEAKAPAKDAAKAPAKDAKEAKAPAKGAKAPAKGAKAPAKVAGKVVRRLSSRVSTKEGGIKTNKHAVRRYHARASKRVLDPIFEEQFLGGFLLAAISSRPGQIGRVDGYLLEGKELEFYQKKTQKKKSQK